MTDVAEQPVEILPSRLAGSIMVTRIAHNIPLMVLLVLSGFGLFGSVNAVREVHAHAAYLKAIAEVEVVAPEASPDFNQESVDIAMVMFSIDHPHTVDSPRYDPALEDRGLTTGGLILPHKTVTVGLTAFTSWAVSGSTLAHEIEIHVDQSFFKIVATDYLMGWQMSARRLAGKSVPALKPSAKESFENDGTWAAEREAYMYEIRNAKRFGLTNEELSSIWRVMDFYYPNRKNNSANSHLSASSQRNNASSSEATDEVQASEL